jgi:hypothetical protein
MAFPFRRLHLNHTLILMKATRIAHHFYVWSAEAKVEGPLELPALVTHVKRRLVAAEDWVYAGGTRTWLHAKDVPELRMFFHPPTAGRALQPDVEVEPDILRRVRVLATLTDEQLVCFAAFMELTQIQQWSTVVQQGDHGDSMYLILEGELRARLLVGDRETTLATFKPRDFFGEISLFDHGPRSADVVANEESTLLRITTASCLNLAIKAPDVATTFLLGIGRTLAARIRADNKRLRELESLAGTIST